MRLSRSCPRPNQFYRHDRDADEFTSVMPRTESVYRRDRDADAFTSVVPGPDEFADHHQDR